MLQDKKKIRKIVHYNALMHSMHYNALKNLNAGLHSSLDDGLTHSRLKTKEFL